METGSSQETLPSGVVIHHWSCSHPPKANLIFQHGFGDYSERWIRDYPFLLSNLHACDIDVWAMDMWGHGSSPGQRSIVHVERAIDDHILLRKRIAGQTDTPLILLGHSLGGLVIAGSASIAPSNVAGVVLLAPALPEPMSPILKSLVDFASRLMPTRQIYRKPADVDTLCWNKDAVMKWQADEKAFHGQISYRLAASALDVAASLWCRLDEWKTPLLAVHGDMDTYTDYKQSLKFVRRVDGEKKEFHLISKGRHDLFSDSGTNSAWEHTLQWINHLLA